MSNLDVYHTSIHGVALC